MARTDDVGVGTTRPSRGPAALAAMAAADEIRGARAYALPHDSAAASDILTAARCALAAASSRSEVALVIRNAITDLGAAVVPARWGEGLATGCLTPDVSLGVGEPLLVAVDPVSVAAMNLRRHLPALLEDAHRAAERCDVAHREPTS